METTTKGYLARYEKFMKDTKLMKLVDSKWLSQIS